MSTATSIPRPATCLRGRRDRPQVGTVIAFDEYFNLIPTGDSTRRGRQKEFVAEFDVSYRYAAFTARDGAVAIEITSL